MLVQALDPLAIAAVGLGPTLDLAGELRRGHNDLKPGLQQQQDVTVDAAEIIFKGGKL